MRDLQKRTLKEGLLLEKREMTCTNFNLIR
jgi:hypothetical protein